MLRLAILIPIFLLFTLISASALHAAVRFLGPTPYLSVADSPFDLSGLGSTFFLDDLEDGDLDWPNLISVGPAEIRGPGPLTDSVDADDGQIDGFGHDGHSLRATSFVTFNSYPPQQITNLNIGFPFGSTANAFGFVWTDALTHPLGKTFIHLNVRLLGSEESMVFDPVMDPFNSGETGEDRFIGVVADSPIDFIQIFSRSDGVEPLSDRFELDHIQFGIQPIPEPNSRGILIWAVVLLSFVQRSRYPLLKEVRCELRTKHPSAGNR